MRNLFLILLLTIPFYVASQTVYITKTGHKYHQSDCKFLKKSRNTIDLEAAKSLGYGPCSKCYPASGEASTYHIEKVEQGFFPFQKQQGIIVSLGFLIAGCGVWFWKRRRNTVSGVKIQEMGFTDLEKDLLKKLSKDLKGVDTYGLNEILSIEHKSQDAQRKARTKFLKLLNQKIKFNFKINDGIIRTNSRDDQRIVFYTLCPDLIIKLKEV